MKTFEIQRYVNGKWVHDSYMDSGDQAVSIARRMADSGKYDGIRVVQDEFIEGEATSEHLVGALAEVEQGRRLAGELVGTGVGSLRSGEQDRHDGVSQRVASEGLCELHDQQRATVGHHQQAFCFR